jgi:predicted small lipoprotein YifL
MKIGKRQMKKTIKNVFLLSLVLTSFVLIIIGCGKKGPPITPKYKVPSSTTDLRGEIQGETLTLTWTVPKKSSGLTGFIVYRSKTSVSEPECETCPVLYERVMDVPILEKDLEHMDSRIMSHSEVLESGYRYIYKVNPYMEGGLIGKDSNYFVFTFESDQDSGTE